MSQVIELTVTIKGDERSQKQKFLIYDKIALVESDPVIAQCLQEAKKNFNGVPDDITIRTIMVIQ